MIAKRFMGAAISFIVALLTSGIVAANPFEVSISPSRFELTGKSSNRIGQSLDIVNLARASTELSVRTLDWTYSDAGSATLVDELLPDSCRPWVTLERRTIKIGAGAKYPFRFQIDVPAGAPRGECRFMLAIEGVEPALKSLIQGGGASLSLPVSGRIAVAVYVAINGAEPKLEVTQVASRVSDGKSTPILTVRNTGDAHGRLEGALDAVDAKGVSFELIPEGTPILPGQTRPIPLTQKTEPNQKPVAVTFPVKATGSLDWEKGSFKVTAEFK